jgi:glutaredoxin 2
MTLFTKSDCRLCEQLKKKFDLAAMQVKVEILDNNDAGALAHLAWHGLVDSARKNLPLLVLDDCSAVTDYQIIEHHLKATADLRGIRYRGSTIVAPVCEGGTCAMN